MILGQFVGVGPMKRKDTKVIKIKDVFIGGPNKIAVQSMTNTKTKNIEETLRQINELTENGCEIVRIAVLDMEDALAISSIVKESPIPVVADIHYDYRLALEAINQGIHKLRLNPANIKDNEKVSQIVTACKEKEIPIRIGVNSGSFKEHINVVESMISYAEDNVNLLENLGFEDIVLSFKSSDLDTTLEVNRIASRRWKYPIHIGMTEAGTEFSGGIKNAIGIGILLSEGIGDTIRVSITGDPVKEIKYCKEILRTLGYSRGPRLISCPTCGRLQYDMVRIAEQVEEYLNSIEKEITVAVMGCSVNGPGEAKQADIGIAGGKNEVLLIKEGKIVRKIKKNIFEELKKEIESI